jgi:hypothetical protein
MWERRSAYRLLLGKLREKDCLEDVDIDGKIIMKWILKKWNGVGVDLSGSE